MEINKRKIVLLILANVFIIASFGLTFKNHYYETENFKPRAVDQFGANGIISSFCYSNEIYNTKDVFETKVKNEYSQLNINKFDLSPSALYNSFQTSINDSVFFKKPIDDIKNSKIIKQLENYYETVQVVIINPTVKFIKFISKISSYNTDPKES